MVFTHRWLGIAGCLLFFAWFASGIVMMYAQMPELSAGERAARRAPLDLSTARIAPHDAFIGVPPPSVISLAMLNGRPVYRAFAGGTWITVFADTAERFAAMTPASAVDEAKRFASSPGSTIQYDGRLTDPDQWTLQHSRSLPMHRVALGDDDDTKLYFAERTGEIVLKTTAATRRIAYVGAVLHWLYFTPLRRHHELWTTTIIWLSLLGTLMCLLGLVWGIYSLSRAPYRGWLRWHHFIGLVFGAASLGWIFSGFLSVDPWDWHASTNPTSAQRRAFDGGPLRLDDLALADLKALVPAGSKGADIVPFLGRARFVVDGKPDAPIGRPDLEHAIAAAMPGVRVADIAWLDEYDAYYYDRGGELPLPVVRARFEDPAATWLYVDPTRGVPVRKEERSSRVNRWLYHGLHSFDFPFLYHRRPLWDIVMIALILGGMGSALTAVAPASRRLWRHVHRWR